MNAPVTNQTVSRAVNVQQIVTPRGVKAWLVEDYAVPLLSLDFAFKGGAVARPARQARARRRCWPRCWTRAPGTWIRKRFSRRSTRKPIEISFNCDRDHIGGRMRTLIRNVDRAGRIAAPCDQRAAARRCADHRACANSSAPGFATKRMIPGSLAGRIWRARTFPGHPYGAPTNGTLESLPNVERADLVSLAAQSRHARRALCRHRRRDRCATRAAKLIDLGLRRSAAVGRSDRGRGCVLWRTWHGRDRRSRRAAIDDPLWPAEPCAP